MFRKKEKITHQGIFVLCSASHIFFKRIVRNRQQEERKAFLREKFLLLYVNY